MQMQMFEAHCVMGADFGLPVIVEVRNSTDAGSLDAEADFWQVRKHFRGLAVIVQLPVSQTFVERSKDEEDLCFLVAGNITYPRAKSIRSLLTQIPLDHLILGSDAPALAPHPHRGKRNEPAYLTHSLEVISNSLEQTLDEIAITTTATANRIFRFESARAAQRSSPPKRPSFG
jgi:TatD DNase family protein